LLCFLGVAQASGLLYGSRMNKTMTYAFFVTLLAAALAGCGGGDFEEEKITQPVDCKATPAQCI
jgi:hypothetical protein